MAPLIVLIAVTLLARLVGRLGVPSLRDWAAATRVGLAVMFCFTAVAHFNFMRADLVRMVPPAIPNPELMVTLTGVCEILGAIGLLLPRTRRVAAIALIVFLLAVLPANIHAAQSGVTLRGAPVTPLVPRVALQVLFIALVWWSGVRASRDRGPEDAMWPFSGRRKPPQRLVQPSVEFVGEQDGPPERELKSALCSIFESRPDVARAYLCRVRYDGSDTDEVVLALSAPEDPILVDQIGQVFWKMLGREIFLDLIFVESHVELQLARVCNPFYSVG